MVSLTALDLWGDTYTFCLTLLVTWAESFLVLLQCNYGRWTRTPCSDGAGAPRRACLRHPRRRQGRALPPRCQTPQHSSASSSHWRHSSGGTRTESLRAARPWRCRYCSSHILHHLPSKKLLCCAKFTSRSPLHLCLLNSFKVYAEAQCYHNVLSHTSLSKARNWLRPLKQPQVYPLQSVWKVQQGISQQEAKSQSCYWAVVGDLKITQDV